MLRALAFIIFIEMAVLAGFGYIEVGVFESLLNEMGGTVPRLTNMYLSSYKYWSVLAIYPLFVLLQNGQSKNDPNNKFGATASILIAHMIFGLLIFVGAIFAMYAPIFQLGDSL